MNESVRWIILILVAYVLGSIPFAYLFGRMKGIDIRQHGSGNVGASNIGRLVGRRWGMLCFALDVLKGVVPVVVAGWWCGVYGDGSESLSTGQMFWLMGVGVAAIVGHMAPVFLGFRGGKGVATAFGAMLGMYPHLTWPALAGLAVWLVCVKLTRIISLSSMLAAAALPVAFVVAQIPSDIDVVPEPWSKFMGSVKAGWPFLLITVLLAVLVIWRHRTNIQRLIAGTEPHIGDPLEEK